MRWEVLDWALPWEVHDQRNWLNSRLSIEASGAMFCTTAAGTGSAKWDSGTPPALSGCTSSGGPGSSSTEGMGTSAGGLDSEGTHPDKEASANGLPTLAPAALALLPLPMDIIPSRLPPLDFRLAPLDVRLRLDLRL
mmetsp:Transcript_104120/g.304006  ORF Transcript_104120/g.304006 Transcript_104120/m.304006 type:complete len:137 (+) Transcript_104120:295-705(+)